MTLTDRDRQLLKHLQNNARSTNAELAELVGLSTSGVQKRVRKLEENGFIDRHASILNRKALGYDMLCFIDVILHTHDFDQVRQFDAAVADLPEIQECHRLTGDSDYLIKIVVRDRDHLDDFLMKTLMPFPAVDRVHTRLVLKEIKETTNIATSAK